MKDNVHRVKRILKKPLDKHNRAKNPPVKEIVKVMYYFSLYRTAIYGWRIRMRFQIQFTFKNPLNRIVLSFICPSLGKFDSNRFMFYDTRNTL